MPTPISLKNLLQMQFKEENYIVGSGLLNPGAIMVIGGQPKSYKSFLLGSICYHLAAATNLFGTTRKDKHGADQATFPVAGPQRVLILEQEMGFQEMQERFRHLVESAPPGHRQLCLENIFIHSCDHNMQLDTQTGVGYIAGLIGACRPSVVAFDPLIEFHTGDENSSQDMARTLRGLDVLREQYGFATIINHHLNKPSRTGDSERDGPDNLRGSSVLYGKGDSFMTVRADGRAHGKLAVSFKLRRGKPIGGLTLLVDQETLLTRFLHWNEGQQRGGGD